MFTVRSILITLLHPHCMISRCALMPFNRIQYQSSFACAFSSAFLCTNNQHVLRVRFRVGRINCNLSLTNGH